MLLFCSIAPQYPSSGDSRPAISALARKAANRCCRVRPRTPTGIMPSWTRPWRTTTKGGRLSANSSQVGAGASTVSAIGSRSRIKSWVEAGLTTIKCPIVLPTSSVLRSIRCDLLRLLTVRVESLATVRNPPPTFLPPPDHARCSLPPSLSRPTSCLPPPAFGPP